MDKPYLKLMWWGFWTMNTSGFILLFQGELLLMFAALVMCLVCWIEIQRWEVDDTSK